MRINEEELDWDEDLSTLNGEPYTGEAFLSYPNGSKKREMIFLKGFPEGLCQEWHPNGFLKCQWFARKGRGEGEVKKWHDNGEVKSIGIYEFGVELNYKEWNEYGDLTLERCLDKENPLNKYLEKMREEGVR